SCFGGNNGFAQITVATGAAPYQFNWSGPGTAQDSVYVNVAEGAVNVTITDANNCTGTAAFNITQPTQLTLSSNGQTNVLCFGGANGSITVNANGSVPPYNYVWSNGGSGASITNITAGTYSVTVTDSHQCTTTL